MGMIDRQIAEGRKVKAALVLHGLRVHEFAARVGIHPSYLGGMLSGRTQMTPKVATRIGQLLRTLDESQA